MPMKVFLASPESRPLFSYIVQEFGYHFCSQQEACDIIVAPDQGRARDEEYALNELLRKIQRYDRSRGIASIEILDKNGKSIQNVDPSKKCKRKSLQPAVKLTKIPGMSDVCEKVRFHRLLQVVKPFFDREGLELCVPDTYILPEQSNLLKKEFHGLAKPTIILKPEYGTQGSGIFLARGLPEINAHIDRLISSGTKKSVAQLYVENPLLLDGLKFDLRLYVVVTEVIPHLKGLLYREGLARFCTTRYKGSHHNDDRNKSESSHLTNYAINKKSLNFKEGHSKRLLSTTLQQLAKRYSDFSISEFWDQMQVISKNILLAISPCLLAEMLATKTLTSTSSTSSSTSNNTKDHSNKTKDDGGVSKEGSNSNGTKDTNFLSEVSYNHVLGLDILLDADFVPWLLELNATPSLSIEKIVLAEKLDALPAGLQSMPHSIVEARHNESPKSHIIRSRNTPLHTSTSNQDHNNNHNTSSINDGGSPKTGISNQNTGISNQNGNQNGNPPGYISQGAGTNKNSMIQDIFRNRTNRRVFGGAICVCGDSVNPHFHIESEVDIRAKYGPIKTLLTDFSKTIHDPSSCFFMPNSAILANSVMQSLCLDHGGRCTTMGGRKRDALTSAWETHGIPRITVNRRGEVAIQELTNQTGLVEANVCPPVEESNLPVKDAAIRSTSTATPADSSTSTGDGTNSGTISGTNSINGSTIVSGTNSVNGDIVSETENVDGKSESDNAQNNAINEDKNGQNLKSISEDKNGQNLKSANSSSSNIVANSSSSNIVARVSANRVSANLSSIKSSINPINSNKLIHDPNQNSLVPHVNPRGVGIKIVHLPNFSECHLLELQRILAQNEAFRSNRTTEPCQCPIILDVCNRNSEDAESITKIYKLFKKIAGLYVEIMINVRQSTGGGHGTNTNSYFNAMSNSNNHYHGHHQNVLNNNPNPPNGTVWNPNKLTLHELQIRISSLVRTEPRLYQKHHQLPFDTILKSLERLQKDLADAHLLSPFPPMKERKPLITLSAAKKGQGLKKKTLEKNSPRLILTNDEQEKTGYFGGSSSTSNNTTTGTTGTTTTGTTSSNNSTTKRGSLISSTNLLRRSMVTGVGSGPAKKRLPTRMVEDTLGSGITQFLLGLTTLCQGGFHYYEDYDLALGVQELIMKIREK